MNFSEIWLQKSQRFCRGVCDASKSNIVGEEKADDEKRKGGGEIVDIGDPKGYHRLC